MLCVGAQGAPRSPHVNVKESKFFHLCCALFVVNTNQGVSVTRIYSGGSRNKIFRVDLDDRQME